MHVSIDSPPLLYWVFNIDIFQNGPEENSFSLSKGEYFAQYLSFGKNIIINSQYGPSWREFGTNWLALPQIIHSHDFKEISHPFCALFSYVQNKRTILGQEKL